MRAIRTLFSAGAIIHVRSTKKATDGVFKIRPLVLLFPNRLGIRVESDQVELVLAQLDANAAAHALGFI